MQRNSRETTAGASKRNGIRAKPQRGRRNQSPVPPPRAPLRSATNSFTLNVRTPLCNHCLGNKPTAGEGPRAQARQPRSAQIRALQPRKAQKNGRAGYGPGGSDPWTRCGGGLGPTWPGQIQGLGFFPSFRGPGPRRTCSGTGPIVGATYLRAAGGGRATWVDFRHRGRRTPSV